MSDVLRGRLLVSGALIAALTLVGAYLAAGGSSYVPEKTQNPCKQRPWGNPEGIQAIAEQFSLSALDGAACKLGVTREALARALATPQSRASFSRRYGIDDAKLAEAIRAGLLRAVGDAERAGALSPLLAAPLRTAVQEVPIGQAIGLIRDARSLLENVQTFLGPAGGLLQQFLPCAERGRLTCRHDLEATRARQPVNAGAELGGRGVKGTGELDDRAEARLAPAPLEQ